MASWENQTSTSTPCVKFEDSPAESFISTPGDMYPSLFESMEYTEGAMTPQTVDEVATPTPEDSVSGTPGPEGSEKKSTKKRKSWGQVLPEPKTNLPPRKRAKTEDEKEQRRVERVLRNRRAAQSSRERKRQEVEALEKRNQELEEKLRHAEAQADALMDQLNQYRSGSIGRGSSPIALGTLSKPLFGSQGSDSKSGMMHDFMFMGEGTVDPASLSPELAPVSDNAELSTPAPEAPTKDSTSAPTSSDMTQHPAAVLCDLQCQSVEVPQSWMDSQKRWHLAPALYFQLHLLLTVCSTMLSACQNPLRIISGALKYNLVLRATPSILSTIIWMVTLPANQRISTSTNSLATISAAQLQARSRATSRSPTSPSLTSASSTLRIKSLQKLLTSNPVLARPLKAATTEFLRLVSNERCDDRVEELADGSLGIKGDQGSGPLLWPSDASLPSREVLLTLLWAIRVEERKSKVREATIVSPPASTEPESSVSLDNETNQTHVLSRASKRKRDVDVNGNKRLRLGY